MWFKYLIILSIISFLTGNITFSQETPAQKDSTQVYRDIEAYSKRSKFTNFFYKLIFKPVVNVQPKKKAVKKKYKKLIQKPYSAFEGKIIRNINIETLDPFGYSISDTSIKPQSSFLIHGNKVHVKTQYITIRNLLLFHQNQPFDSLLVKESERLVRTRNYVHDVTFFVKTTSKNSDSVDILIRELDKWSLIPKFSASSTNISIDLTDKNFLGLGHESYNNFDWNHAKGKFAYDIKYFIPNVRNTYINSTIHLNSDRLNNSVSSFALDRPFFSPMAKWAAGVSFTHQNRSNYVHTYDSLLVRDRFKFNTQDYWIGNAIHLSDKGTNFITTLRYSRIRYFTPVEMYDVQDKFRDEDFYMAGIGVSTRNYVQDKFIFKYGMTEDVPIGSVFSVTAGYQVNKNIGRMYLGTRLSLGNYYPWGYLSSSYEYGTFFRSSHTEQGIFSASVTYFTGLVELGRWKFRQFAKPQVIIGINRLTTDSVTLNDGYGMDGFNSPSLSGTSRLLFTLQTQSYAPWNLIGFHFGPFLILSLGMLGDEETRFRNKKVYSQIALGVLIKNENLIISTFQLSLAWYPMIPGKGQNILKMNTFKTTDFNFRDFEIEKPAVVGFQ
ncbi:MAG TPA: hypothetical protein VK179_13680 [Bacteroidales bacterium]|nr:hypothetical protein [Bacteroidales bacterium]